MSQLRENDSFQLYAEVNVPKHRLCNNIHFYVTQLSEPPIPGPSLRAASQ